MAVVSCVVKEIDGAQPLTRIFIDDNNGIKDAVRPL